MQSHFDAVDLVQMRVGDWLEPLAAFRMKRPLLRVILFVAAPIMRCIAELCRKGKVARHHCSPVCLSLPHRYCVHRNAQSQGAWTSIKGCTLGMLGTLTLTAWSQQPKHENINDRAVLTAPPTCQGCVCISGRRRLIYVAFSTPYCHSYGPYRYLYYDSTEVRSLVLP